MEQRQSHSEDKLTSALAGNYNFSIKAVFQEAWARTKGFKGTFLGAICFYGLCLLPAYFLAFLSVIMILNVSNVSLLSTILMSAIAGSFILGIVCTVLPSLTAGLWMLGINRAADNPCKAKMVFGYFNKKWKLFLAFFFTFLITFVINLSLGSILGIVSLIGTALFPNINPWIGLSAYYTLQILTYIPALIIGLLFLFVCPLIVEKELSVLDAINTSSRIISHKLFKLLGIKVCYLLMLLVPVIPVMLAAYFINPKFHLLVPLTFIAYIWLLPFVHVIWGILYRDIIGISTASP